MAWRLAKSLVKLRSQVNKAYPNRNKASDGTIGDQAHSSRVSQHNPNSAGVVTALDITHDPKNGADMNKLKSQLIKDSRTWYVIFNRRIWQKNSGWQNYTGSNPHDRHLHISVKQTAPQYDNSKDWTIGGKIKKEKIMKPSKQEVVTRFIRHLKHRPTDKQINYYSNKDERTLFRDILNTGVEQQRKPTVQEVKDVFATQLNGKPTDKQIKHYTARDVRNLYRDVMQAKPKAGGYTPAGVVDYIKDKLGV